jgi:hypothetical protein
LDAVFVEGLEEVDFVVDLHVDIPINEVERILDVVASRRLKEKYDTIMLFIHPIRYRPSWGEVCSKVRLVRKELAAIHIELCMEKYPTTYQRYGRRFRFKFPLDHLCFIIAHELQHLVGYIEDSRVKKMSCTYRKENASDVAAMEALKKWRAKRYPTQTPADRGEKPDG